MIITGMLCLVLSALLLVLGSLRASTRQLFGAAVLALFGLAFVLAGTAVAKKRKGVPAATKKAGGATATEAPAPAAYVIAAPGSTPQKSG